jgi:DNA-binding transcriptional regulator YdaS (Cro superfamily)
MKLCDYMYFNKITSSELAKKLGCSRAQITIAKAGKKVSKWFARDLERATNGEVTVAEILPFPAPKQEPEEDPKVKIA